MSFKRALLRRVNGLLGRLDAAIVRASDLAALERQAAEGADLRTKLAQRSAPPLAPPLPEGAESYLRPDNPRLAELRSRYAELGNAATNHSQWTDPFVRRWIDLRRFREDNAYVFQHRDLNTEAQYLLTAHYVMQRDPLALLGRLGEDGLFGAATYWVEGAGHVSRDLLDSIVETYFLERHLGLSRLAGANVLDIGAGYGRLAHRMPTALPGLGTYVCADAVAESTFLCEYYLGFRGLAGRARAVPVFEIENAVAHLPITLAVNVHSFSECSLSAIGWWLDLLERHRVRYLMIVPNAETHGGHLLLSQERDGTRADMLPSLEAHGYRRIVQEPKYDDALVQRHGLSPTRHHLFGLCH